MNQKALLYPLLILVTLASASALADDDAADCEHPDQAIPASAQLADVAKTVFDIAEIYGPYENSPECIQDKTDPYDPGYRITYGDYQGQCIDSSSVRPPVVLKQDDQRITFANFYHDGKYWIATIPKNAVESVKFQGVPFDEYLWGFIEIKHGQFRFKLSQPITLREQAGSKTEARTLDDIIISSTVTKPKGVNYSIFKGSSFGIATRALSSTARGVEEIAVDKSHVHQYEVELHPKAKSDFLIESIARASQLGYRELYDLLDRNCVTESFDSLDAAIPPANGVRPLRGHWWQFRDEIEKPALQALKKRHMPFTKVQEMNDEMTCAKAGETLDGEIVDPAKLGAAAGACRFNPPRPKPAPLP